jgi:hypothetical protein
MPWVEIVILGEVLLADTPAQSAKNSAIQRPVLKDTPVITAPLIDVDVDPEAGVVPLIPPETPGNPPGGKEGKLTLAPKIGAHARRGKISKVHGGSAEVFGASAPFSEPAGFANGWPAAS